tara:strand:+ start:3712 stop:3903 length:192 start_codon:yes stop_codon:yes gene_type:complete
VKIEVGTMIWRTTDPMIGFVEKVSGDMYYIRWYALDLKYSTGSKWLPLVPWHLHNIDEECEVL